VAKKSREKGKRGEREVVALAKRYGLQSKRTWETAQHIGDPASRACDIIIGELPYQIKLQATGFKTIYDMIEHVNGAFIRMDGKPWLLIIPAERYLAIKENFE